MKIIAVNFFALLICLFLINSNVNANEIIEKHNSIHIIDVLIDKSVQINQNTSKILPSIVRCCIDGYEFVFISNGPAISAVQVYSDECKPKKCN